MAFTDFETTRRYWRTKQHKKALLFYMVGLLTIVSAVFSDVPPLFMIGVVVICIGIAYALNGWHNILYGSRRSKRRKSK